MLINLILFLMVSILMPAHAKEVIELSKKDLPPALLSPIYERLYFQEALDGETILAANRTIKLWGIDAPGKDDPLYTVSTKALSIFLEVGTLECAVIGDNPNTEKELMHCLSDGVDVGAMMIKTGFAREYPLESKGFYKGAETFAQEGKLGIWEETE